ncbi:MAG: hypothetical protein CMA63_01740 [Euryarchaeota archaeon]|nr:hypothetical protein [Euryarchaeota archaeon]
MLGEKARAMVAGQIEKKLLEKGMNLNNLTDEELSAVAVNFVGDAPPNHVPRETVIQILSEQDSVLIWANSVKENAAKAALESVRTTVDSAQNKVAAVTEDNPMAAMMMERFSTWLKESGYTAAQLTQMLDTNKDGIISRTEITSMIEQMAGSQPPQWVVDYLVEAIDLNGDGALLVSEFGAFLASIGFETVQLTPPEPEAVEDTTPQPEETHTHHIEVTPIPEPVVAPEPTPVAEPVSSPVVTPVLPTEVEEDGMPSIDSDNERMIEMLQASRLNSEAAAIIARCTNNPTSMMVERVERTLMVNDEFRGGHSLIGELDDGPFTVAIMFPESDNELIHSIKKGDRVECSAIISDWSSGLRRATLQGSNARVV